MSSRFRSIAPVLLATFILSLAARAADTPAVPPAPSDPNALSLQVSALRTLYILNLSADQLHSLKALTANTADPSPRKPATVTQKLTDALTTVRSAILAGQDDAVSDAEEALDDAWDAETYDIADTVTPTDASRANAPVALKLLKPSQAITYIGHISSDVLDPVDTLVDAAEESAGQSEDAFASLRDHTAEDISLAIAGVDHAKANALRQKIAAFLESTHKLTADEVAAQHASLTQEAKTLLGDIDALAVVRNEVERNLAELLANPQTPAMIDALADAREHQASSEAAK